MLICCPHCSRWDSFFNHGVLITDLGRSISYKSACASSKVLDQASLCCSCEDVLEFDYLQSALWRLIRLQMCRLIWVLTGFTCNHVGNAVPQLNFHASPWKLFLCDLLEAVNTGNDMYKLKSWSCWTRICPAFANIVDPDQLASAEANWSGSALFVIKYVNLYQQPGSSILIGCTLEVGMTSKFIQCDKS